MQVKSATINEIMDGKVGRITEAEAKTAVSKMSKKTIMTMEAEDKDYERSFIGIDNFTRGAVIGRPKKEIKREVIAIRVPTDAIAQIKSLGKGWSTRAGDALARMAASGSL